MKTCKIIAVLSISVTMAMAQSELRFSELGDFQLESGAVIKNCRIGYRIYGELNSARSNVILYPTWFGGTSQEIGKLISPEKLVDLPGYCIIAVDALGNGVSSSPSNSREQPATAFPVFNIRDMVRTQYRLLTEHLGIKHLAGLIGGSMGSFQGFEWLVLYPGFIDRAVLYVCSPCLTSYDRLQIHTQLVCINEARRCGQSEQVIAKQLDMFTALFAQTPQYRVRTTPITQFDDYLSAFEKSGSSTFTVDNRASQLLAMANHDIGASWGGSLSRAAQSIQARVLIIVAQKDMLVNPQPALDFAPLIRAQVMVLENDCGHLGVNCEMQKVRKAIGEFFSQTVK